MPHVKCIVDVNIVADSKRRLGEVSLQVKENLSSDALNYGTLCERIKDLEIESSQESFWDNQLHAHDTMQQITTLKILRTRIDRWNTALSDVESLIDLSSEDATSSCKHLVPYHIVL